MAQTTIPTTFANIPPPPPPPPPPHTHTHTHTHTHIPTHTPHTHTKVLSGKPRAALNIDEALAHLFSPGSFYTNEYVL